MWKKIAPMRAILHRLKARYPQIHIWHPEEYIKSSIYEGDLATEMILI